MPLGDPGNWVTSADYPSTALMDGLTGITAFKLTIDKEGRVSNCQVTQSSGANVLDDSACNLITQRAVFSPATNAAGKPVEGIYSNRVRWQIPEARPLVFPFSIEVSYTVDTDGGIHDCKVDKIEGGPAAADPTLVARYFTKTCQGRRSDVYRDADNRPISVRIRQTTTTTVDPLP